MRNSYLPQINRKCIIIIVFSSFVHCNIISVSYGNVNQVDRGSSPPLPFRNFVQINVTDFFSLNMQVLIISCFFHNNNWDSIVLRVTTTYARLRGYFDERFAIALFFVEAFFSQ